jgi:hypothetical protein
MLSNQLKPRYPTFGSRAARAELPAAIGGYSVPTDFSDEAKTQSLVSSSTDLAVSLALGARRDR